MHEISKVGQKHATRSFGHACAQYHTDRLWIGWSVELNSVRVSPSVWGTGVSDWMNSSSGYGLMASIEGSRLPPMLESDATVVRSSGVRTVLCVSVVMTEMVVIKSCLRNRREARFHLSMGKVFLSAG